MLSAVSNFISPISMHGKLLKYFFKSSLRIDSSRETRPASADHFEFEFEMMCFQAECHI